MIRRRLLSAFVICCCMSMTLSMRPTIPVEHGGDVELGVIVGSRKVVVRRNEDWSQASYEACQEAYRNGLSNIEGCLVDVVAHIRRLETAIDVNEELRHFAEAARERKAVVVTIRGLMSSGTGFLRTLLQKNCANLMYNNSASDIDSDGILGWKHGHIFPSEVERVRQEFYSPWHRVLVIERQKDSWLDSVVSMMRRGALGAPLRELFASGVKKEGSFAISKVSMRAFMQTPVLIKCPSRFSWLGRYYKSEYGAKVCLYDELLQAGAHLLDYRSAMLRNWTDTVNDILGPSLGKVISYEALTHGSRDARAEAAIQLFRWLPPAAKCTREVSQVHLVDSHVKEGEIKYSEFDRRAAQGRFQDSVDAQGSSLDVCK
ncbi:Hypothetical Protein FCC1311_103272 [Hondaea fermentalgiana]|uniref:Sulfotransferase n=1 Tax=Hondaea fermentalgiana TaxID=2315210 RepID=A0A2R5H197_9STRA|nr:Hypothetical Protein FCC1311_103272 [Hondaea fermentalgiana]|eukprot:GBG34104.1 Hypothetical Protein FCC1311_103272 [Hondaea fermentalgiana]